MRHEDNEMLAVTRANKDYWIFAKVDNAVLLDPTLSPIDKVTFAVLCSHADKNTNSWTLKNETIAHEAGCSVRSVQRSMAKLEERGIIKRHARFIERNQRANLIEIIGRDAPCYQKQEEQKFDDLNEKLEEFLTPCHSVTPYRATVSPHTMTQSHTNYENHVLRESLITRKKDKKITLSEATQNAAGEIQVKNSAYKEPEKMPEENPAENLPERFSPSEAPEVMRATAEYLLLKTGRKALTEPELSALRTLAAGHYPARVQKEIDTACERFKRNGRNLAELNFYYIANALKYQASRPLTRAAPKFLVNKQSDEFKRAMADFNRLEENEKREYTEVDIARLEAELAEEMSKNGF